jgi:hypothetical protein
MFNLKLLEQPEQRPRISGFVASRLQPGNGIALLQEMTLAKGDVRHAIGQILLRDGPLHSSS